MDENRFKKLLDEAIEPLQKDLIDVKEDLIEVKETQKDHTRRLEALSGNTEQLLMDVKGIRDKEGMAHSRNKREIDEIKKHLNLPLIPDTPEV